MSSTPLLDLSLLQTLVAIQHAGTLARAADKVGHTQSALSLQTQRPEQTLGVELFDRNAARSRSPMPGRRSSIREPPARPESGGGELRARPPCRRAGPRGHFRGLRAHVAAQGDGTLLQVAPEDRPRAARGPDSSFEQAVGRKEPDIALISGRVTRWRSREMRPLPLS